MSAADQEHLNRQIGGYKATLSNEHTSEEAKAHARSELSKLTDPHANDHAGYKAHHGYEHDKGKGEVENQGGHKNRVIGGYKATLSNDHTSEEAKFHARIELDKLTGEKYIHDKVQHGGVHRHEHKSKGTKHAHTQGHEHGHEKHPESAGTQHENRVIGGLKATLSNPNTSEEAKEHARKVLKEEHGVTHI